MAAGRQRFIQSPYFATGDPETEEMTTLYAPGMLGCLADFDRGSNNICQYQLVQQAASISGVVGSVLVWSAKGTYTATTDRKSTRLNSSHIQKSRMPSSA